jgi:dihydrofolate reductase
MNDISTLAIDLAKQVFQLHGVDARGACQVRRQVRRAQLFQVISQLPPCTVVMEACGGAHEWGRPSGQMGAMPDWMKAFGRTIDAKRKYVVSSTLNRVDWNAELVCGNLENAVQLLKRESEKGLLVGGVKLPLALTELGLIDEYEFVVHPRLVGHGPTLFAGLSKRVDLRLVSRLEFGSGAVVMRYEPRK